jgi:hypothetical protein
MNGILGAEKIDIKKVITKKKKKEITVINKHQHSLTKPDLSNRI